jgi:hypothetical protein
MLDLGVPATEAQLAEEREKLRAKTHMVNPAMWILDNKFINENQKPIEFTGHRFMLQPYSDSSPWQVIRKSAQVGWSVLAILKSVHAANFIKLNVIYVLPTRNASAEFVTPKVNPMLRRNPELAKLVKGTDNKSLKEVGDRWIYFKGAFNEGEAISTSADLVVADEYDRSNQDVLSMYQSRLQASSFRWYWRFSNPSIPNYGVDELFKRSDQMHWWIACGHCGYETHIDFEREYVGEDEEGQLFSHYVKILDDEPEHEAGYYACGYCDKELTNADRQNGRWVAKYPDRKLRGYWICQMMVPWVSAVLILEQRNSMDTQTFYNMVLGKAYQPSEFLINRDSILNSRRFDTPDRKQMFLGVDSGKEKHWVLGNWQGVISYGKYTSWDDIETLIQLNKAMTVIDALPDFTIPAQLAEKYPGQVYVNYYSHDTKNIAATQEKEGDEAGVLVTDRTKIFDIVAMEIANQQLGFYLAEDALHGKGKGIISHFENMYRVTELDTKGIARARWETKGEGESKSPDHWAHATVYYRIARSMALEDDQTGGIPAAGKNNLQGKRTFTAGNNNPKAKAVLGMDTDTLIEKSLQRHKKRRI